MKKLILIGILALFLIGLSAIVAADTGLLNPNIKLNGVEIWKHEGEFTGNATLEDFSNQINQFLATCMPDEDGMCHLTVEFDADSQGQLNVDEMEIIYQQQMQPPRPQQSQPF